MPNFHRMVVIWLCDTVGEYVACANKLAGSWLSTLLHACGVTVFFYVIITYHIIISYIVCSNK